MYRVLRSLSRTTWCRTDCHFLGTAPSLDSFSFGQREDPHFSTAECLCVMWRSSLHLLPHTVTLKIHKYCTVSLSSLSSEQQRQYQWSRNGCFEIDRRGKKHTHTHRHPTTAMHSWPTHPWMRSPLFLWIFPFSFSFDFFLKPFFLDFAFLRHCCRA